MMSVHNPFVGHSRTSDPRTPLWCAGGSVFPTTPAYKYRLGSQYATGQWSFLRSTGVLFEPGTTQLHDISRYNATEGVAAPFQWMRLWRTFMPWLDEVQWLLQYKMCEKAWIWHTLWYRHREKTNRNMRFAWQMPVPDIPGSPDLSELHQVEHDDRLPPGGWPPW